MSLRVRLSEDITHAMKSQGREREQLAVLRLLLAAVKNEEIAIQVRTEGLTDEQMIAVVRREVKKRRDAVAMYRQHGEETRAAAEESEMKVL